MFWHYSTSFWKKISTHFITQSPLKSTYKNPKIKNFLKVKMYAQKPPAGSRSTCGAKFLNFYVFFVFLLFLISQKLSASDKQLLLRKNIFSKQCKYIIDTSYHTWNIIFHTASTSKHMVNFILCWWKYFFWKFTKSFCPKLKNQHIEKVEILTNVN